jgi:two-component system response regulator HydG
MKSDTADILKPAFASSLLESMASGVFTLNDEGAITSWNPAMQRISGYSPEEAVGQKCTLLKFSRCFNAVCPLSIKKCGIYKHGKVDGKECYLQHKRGHNVPVIKSARLVTNSKGEVEGIVETVTDLQELYKARLEAEEANLRLGEIHRLDNVIGKSQAMNQVFLSLKAASGSDATVLIQGESGTGKELVAGAIHYNSERSNKPFVTVNCSALAESLLESELFGHVRGAFTGAVRDRAGRFEQADGGTLFLDEIGDISPFIQTKLLRALQEKEIERVGDSKKRKVNIRIIAATNKDLFGLVRNGNFREDLYYRLKVFPITIPPLRKRKEDIPLLLSHLIKAQNNKSGKQIEGVSTQAMRIIMDYSWPGNVRELENAIEHAFVLCTEKHIDIFDLPIEIRQVEYHLASQNPSPANIAYPNVRQKLTRDRLLDLLQACDWNKAEVSRRIGLSRTSIWKYMKKWSIPLSLLS